MSQWFTIARIVPERLGLNGTAASGEILAATLRHRGHQVSLVDVHGPEGAPSTVDIVTLGSTSTSQIAPTTTELISLVRIFQSWKDQGAWWVGIGVGWDVLGTHITLSDGERLPGAGIFPTSADHRPGRLMGEVVGTDYRGRPSAGYVNQVGVSELGDGVVPLMDFTGAPDGFPSTDGAVGERLWGTRLGGPALALNPHWSADIVSGVLASRGLSSAPSEFDERVEDVASKARSLIENRVLNRR
ncbi:MAG: hypothetical protein RL187_170 [Actinomycetota bacterium]